MHELLSHSASRNPSVQLIYCGFVWSVFAGDLSPGCESDWMKGRMGVRYAYGLEVYPDGATNSSKPFHVNSTLIESCGQELWAGISAAAAALQIL